MPSPRKQWQGAPPKVRKGTRKTAAAAWQGSDEPGGSSPSENGEGGFQVSFGFAWSPSILIPQLFPWRISEDLAQSLSSLSQWLSTSVALGGAGAQPTLPAQPLPTRWRNRVILTPPNHQILRAEPWQISRPVHVWPGQHKRDGGHWPHFSVATWCCTRLLPFAQHLLGQGRTREDGSFNVQGYVTVGNCLRLITVF